MDEVARAGAAAGVAIDALLACKPGRYRISEGIRDEASGLTGFAVVGATAGPVIQ